MNAMNRDEISSDPENQSGFIYGIKRALNNAGYSSISDRTDKSPLDNILIDVSLAFEKLKDDKLIDALRNVLLTFHQHWPTMDRDAQNYIGAKIGRSFPNAYLDVDSILAGEEFLTKSISRETILKTVDDTPLQNREKLCELFRDFSSIWDSESQNEDIKRLDIPEDSNDDAQTLDTPEYPNDDVQILDIPEDLNNDVQIVDVREEPLYAAMGKSIKDIPEKWITRLDEKIKENFFDIAMGIYSDQEMDQLPQQKNAITAALLQIIYEISEEPEFKASRQDVNLILPFLVRSAASKILNNEYPSNPDSTEFVERLRRKDKINLHDFSPRIESTFKLLERLDDTMLGDIAVHERWKVGVDPVFVKVMRDHGVNIDSNPYLAFCFDKEPAYMCGIAETWNVAMEVISSKKPMDINVNDFIKLNEALGKMARKFRISDFTLNPVKYNFMTDGKTLTREGFSEIIQFFEEMKEIKEKDGVYTPTIAFRGYTSEDPEFMVPLSEIPEYPVESSIGLRRTKLEEDQCIKLIECFFDKYYKTLLSTLKGAVDSRRNELMDMRGADSISIEDTLTKEFDDEVIAIVTKLNQAFERLHFKKDGNCRMFGNIFLNTTYIMAMKFLGLKPSITMLDDPIVIDGFSVKQMVEVFKKGREYVASLAKSPRGMRAEIEHLGLNSQKYTLQEIAAKKNIPFTGTIRSETDTHFYLKVHGAKFRKNQIPLIKVVKAALPAGTTLNSGIKVKWKDGAPLISKSMFTVTLDKVMEKIFPEKTKNKIKR